MTPERRAEIAQWAANAGGFPGHAISDLLAEVDRLRSVEAAAVEWFEAGADVVSPDARAHRANYNLRRAVRAALSGEHPERNDG